MKANQLKQLEDAGLALPPVKKINGRELICGGKKFIDFAGTNYLGFDFRDELRLMGDEYSKKWGSLCGWSRLEADPEIFRALERRTAHLIGANDTLISHTITLMNFSVLPKLADKGIIFADEKVHTVVWEACRLARDHGAGLVKFKHQDLNHLEELLKAHPHIHPKLIAVDGVYSISTELAPIDQMSELCRKYNAWLYIDDAHGFGILGEKPSTSAPFGKGGAGVNAYFAADYKRTFYVSNFGKAFCVNTSFISIPEEFDDYLPSSTLSHIYSAPPSPHAIGMVNAAITLNEQIGDQARDVIYQHTKTFCEGLRNLDYNFMNKLYQPVVFVPIGTIDQLVPFAAFLKDHGILTGLRAYPVVPKHECGVRFAFTALHTQSQIHAALEVLSEYKSRSRTRSNEQLRTA